MNPIADREAETGKLASAAESAFNRLGKTLLISGEAGMGKSTLCEYASDIAVEKGFESLKGWCFPEYLKPYLPIENALRPLGISHLFRMSASPKVARIFLISKAGILLSSVGEENEALDEDIFTGMLSAVGSFVRDSMEAMAGEGSLDVLGYGGMRIIMEKGELCSIAAVISGKENEYLINDLKDALDRVHKEYGDFLRDEGSMDEIEGSKEILRSIMESGKYEGTEVTDGDPKLRMGNIMDNVTLALLRKSEDKPILLVIEDLQWADSATLALIYYLSRNIRDSRILLIGTYRPDEMGNSRETLGRMLDEAVADEMEISPVPERCLRNWLIERLEGIEGKKELAEHITGESGGNPMFASEILGMLLENKGKEIRIPKRIQSVIRGKLDRLSDEEKEILEAASVLGQEFTSGIIAKMLEKRKIMVLKSLKKMHEKSIIDESSGKYRFSNPTIRKVLYSEMGTELARAYHELAAGALESKEEKDNAAIGYHYYAAGIPDKAVPYLFKAAEDEMRNYSNEEVVKTLGQILEVSKGENRLRALRSLAETHMRTGDYEKAQDCLKNALDIAEGPGKAEILRMMAECRKQVGDYEGSLDLLKKGMELADMHEKARILLVNGNVRYRKGDYDGAMNALSDALELLEMEEGAQKEQATAIRAIGNIYFSRGEYAKALEEYEKALNADENDLSGKAMSYNNMGVVNIRIGNYQKAAEYFRKALKIREKIGDQWGVSMFLSNLGVVLSESGDYDGAMANFRDSLRIRERIGDKWGTAMSLNNIGLIHLEKGDYAEAIRNFSSAMEMREKMGDSDGIAASVTTMAMAYAEAGDIGRALELYEKAVSMKKELGDRDGMAEALGGMGRAYVYAGECEKAEEKLRNSEQICRETGNKRMLAYDLCALAESSMECGDTDIKGIISELETLVAEIEAREVSAWYLRIKGVYAYMNGEDGSDYLKESLELFEEMGRKGDIAKTLYWIGKMNEDEKSMNKAKEIFEGCGMKRWIEKCGKS